MKDYNVKRILFEFFFFISRPVKLPSALFNGVNILIFNF